MKFADKFKCEICIKKEEIQLSYKESQLTLKTLVIEVGWNSIVQKYKFLHSQTNKRSFYYKLRGHQLIKCEREVLVVFAALWPSI